MPIHANAPDFPLNLWNFDLFIGLPGLAVRFSGISEFLRKILKLNIYKSTI
jgi:hypothetical protein